MAILFKCDNSNQEPWLAALRQHLPDFDLRIYPEIGAVEDIDYAFVHAPPTGLLKSLPNLKAVFSLWAGVEHITRDPELPKVPIVHMAERGMATSMAEYVAAQVLRFARRLDDYRDQQLSGRWQPLPHVLPWHRRIGILGLGHLGQAAASALLALGYDVAGWSRSPKSIAGVTSFSGADGLSAMLARSNILVCLLPLTASTMGVLNRELFAKLPRGAFLVNCARGGHLVEGDLLSALADGQLAAAALDVFSEEPLPDDHPFWRHPKIFITPHSSAPTIPETAVESVAANIRGFEAGRPLKHVVDLAQGY